MKVEVVNMEKELLRSFGFLLHTGHPHRFLLTYLNTLKLHDIMQDAWNIVNDRLVNYLGLTALKHLLQHPKLVL